MKLEMPKYTITNVRIKHKTSDSYFTMKIQLFHYIYMHDVTLHDNNCYGHKVIDRATILL